MLATDDLTAEFSVWSGGHDFEETSPEDREWFAEGRSEADVRQIFADQPPEVLDGLVLRLAALNEQ